MGSPNTECGNISFPAIRNKLSVKRRGDGFNSAGLLELSLDQPSHQSRCRRILGWPASRTRTS